MAFKTAFLATLISTGVVGQTYTSSFTRYGSPDGTGTCNSRSACGIYTNPGYSAAVSQNLYGTGSGSQSTCGTCWRLTIEKDGNGNKISNAGNSIVVKVTNECPRAGNPLCSQATLSSTNSLGAQVNFDTCYDSGATAALFGNSGTALGVGTAAKVSCSEWKGTVLGAPY